MTKVFPLNVVVRFDEDLSQDGLSYGIVFGVELVKAMESVAVLQKDSNNLSLTDAVVWLNQYLSFQHQGTFIDCFFISSSWALLTACMSRVSTLRSKAVRFMVSNTSMSV